MNMHLVSTAQEREKGADKVPTTKILFLPFSLDIHQEGKISDQSRNIGQK